MTKRSMIGLAVTSATVLTVLAVGVPWRASPRAIAIPPAADTGDPPAMTAESPTEPPAGEAAKRGAPRVVAHPASSAAAPLPDEASLMAQLRAVHLSDPELSLRIARQGNARFPDSPDAAERAAEVVKALMRMGRADEATAEARAMVDAYPGTPWALDVKHHMLDVPSYVAKGTEP